MQIKKITYFVSTIMAISLAGCGADSGNQNNKTDATTAGVAVNQPAPTSMSTKSANTPDIRLNQQSAQMNQSVAVKITDVNNQPIENATVLIKEKIKVKEKNSIKEKVVILIKEKTNKLGFAVLNKVDSSKALTLEVISKGFITQSIALKDNSNPSRAIFLQLKEQQAFTVVDDISASTDGSSSISGGLPDRVVCPANYDPVCVEEEVNGKVQFNTYSNDCDISNGQGRIINKTKGVCPANGTPPAATDPIGVPDLGSACTAEYKPVCAEEEVNGKIQFTTYSNECHLSNGKGKLIKQTEGACPVNGTPPATNPVGGLPDLGSACTAEYKPVCAEEEVNGKIQFTTYSNECHLSNGKGKLIKQTKGACPVNGTPPATDPVGLPDLGSACTAEYEPICAEEEVNGKIQFTTYSNECHLSNGKGKLIKQTKGACPVNGTPPATNPVGGLPDLGLVCTTEYKPVCVKEEVNGEVQFHTYSNDCAAATQGIGKYLGQTKGVCPASPHTSSLPKASITYGQDTFMGQHKITSSGKAQVAITSWNSDSREDMNSFLGLGSGEVNVQLHSLGAVDIKVSKNNEPLKIINGKFVKVTAPLSLTTYEDGRKVLVGDSVPLWHFSTDSGIWEQKGTGTVESKDNKLVLEAKIDQLGSWSWGDKVTETKKVNIACQLNDGLSVPCSVETTLGSANNGYYNGHLLEVEKYGSSNNLIGQSHVVNYTGRYYDAKKNIIYVGNVHNVDNSNNITIKLNEVESPNGLVTANNPVSKSIKVDCILPNGVRSDKCIGLANIEYSLNGYKKIKPLHNKFEIKDGVLLIAGIPFGAVITKVDISIATPDARYFTNQKFNSPNGFAEGIKVKLRDSLVNNNPETVAIHCENNFNNQTCKGDIIVAYRDISTNLLKTKNVSFESNAGSPYILKFDVQPNRVFSLTIKANTTDESYYEYFDVATGIKSEVTLGNTIAVYPSQPFS